MINTKLHNLKIREHTHFNHSYIRMVKTCVDSRTKSQPPYIIIGKTRVESNTTKISLLQQLPYICRKCCYPGWSSSSWFLSAYLAKSFALSFARGKLNGSRVISSVSHSIFMLYLLPFWSGCPGGVYADGQGYVYIAIGVHLHYWHGVVPGELILA